MKKYTDKHLESVEPEFIVALEIIIDKLKNGCGCLEACPQTEIKISVCENKSLWCSKKFKYARWSFLCPCHYFGREQAIIEAQNLIDCWKQWAGIEE